jgi:hypothetical protein
MRWRLMKVEESKVASRNPRQDRLSREQLMANFGITEATLGIDDDLFDLFQEAYDNNWQGATGKALFDAKLKQTTWWQENSKYMRDYLMRSANPDMDWQMLVDDSEEAVRQEAMKLGVTLSDAEVDDYTQQSMMYGWYDEANKFKLRRAIEARPRTGGGDIGSLVEQLRAYSREMGVTYDQKWYDSAASSIATDRTDGEYWKDQIRKQSASMFPMFRDSIMAGQSMASIASPYRAMMQEEWDVPADSISVTDPIILRAMGGDGGNQMMNLADFQRMLRRDPRWMETDKAQNDITGIASGVLKMFGMSGG